MLLLVDHEYCAVPVPDVQQLTHVFQDSTSYNVPADRSPQALEHSQEVQCKIPQNTAAENCELPQLPFHTMVVNDQSCLDTYDLNNLFNVGGSCINAMLKKKMCNDCKEFLKCNGDENSTYDTLVNYLNRGGLKKPNQIVEKLIYNCELLFRKYKSYILSNGNSKLISKIVEDIDVDIPTCCNLKQKIVKHFFIVRSFSVVDFHKNNKRKCPSYGTATSKKK